MAKIIKLHDRLTNAIPKIEIAKGEVYEVDDSKNTVLAVQEITSESGGIEVIFQALDMLLGKKAVEEIEKNHPTYTTRLSTITVLFKGVMAAISGTDYEEADEASKAEFRK